MLLGLDKLSSLRVSCVARGLAVNALLTVKPLSC